jgi:crossover junction endodeoxyribonuclease RuvC
VIYLGIDPGLAHTGVGIVQSQGQSIRHLHHSVIETKAGSPQALRLLAIKEALEDLLGEFSPQAASVETLYFAKNVGSALPVSEARGAVLLTLADLGIPVFEYTPLVIKQTVVGVGRAEKAQVQEMVRLILGLQEVPRPDHAADALAAAICLHQSGDYRGFNP